MKIKLIIAGGRDYRLTPADFLKLDQLATKIDINEVVTGRAEGADADGEWWADVNFIRVKPFPALWDDLSVEGAVVRYTASGRPYNAMAGPQRNRRMAEYADAVVLFPGGTGTTSMRKEAMRARITIYDFTK